MDEAYRLSPIQSLRGSPNRWLVRIEVKAGILKILSEYIDFIKLDAILCDWSVLM